MGLLGRTTITAPSLPRFSLLVPATVGNNGKRGNVEGIELVTSDRQDLCNWLTRALARGFILAVSAAFGGNVCGQDPGPGLGPGATISPSWKSGAALRKSLDTPVSLVWGDRETRGAFDSLARSTGVAIFLDRRIDPSHLLTLKVVDEPLRSVLLSAAGQVEAGVVLVGSVVYVGPKATSGKLLALASLRRQETGKLPAEARIRLTKSEAWSWAEPAEPRQLLNDLATRGGVRVENPELVPHDLWPAANLPVLTWTERMTLLLAGFDLTYELKDQRTIRLVPLPERLVFERTYSPQGDADRAAIDLRRLVPEAKIAVERGALRVSATAEDHERVDRLLGGDRVTNTKVTLGKKRYTLTVANKPAGAVLKTVAAQISRDLKFDASLTEKLRTEVSLEVNEVSLEELLDKTLKPLGLTYRVDETALVIVAGP